MGSQTNTQFEGVCTALLNALPSEYKSGDVDELFHQKFVDDSQSRTIKLLLVENKNHETWFELEGYEDGQLQNSKPFQSEDELVSFLKKDSEREELFVDKMS